MKKKKKPNLIPFSSSSTPPTPPLPPEPDHEANLDIHPQSISTQIEDSQDPAQVAGNVESVMESLKKQVAENRVMLVKQKIDENNRRVRGYTDNVYSLTKTRRQVASNADASTDLLTRRREEMLVLVTGQGMDGNDYQNSSYIEDVTDASSILYGSNTGVVNVSHTVKLMPVEKVPPYTTWMFLERNQRMTEDQSVVGRRRIYYDQNGGEALICSDSEDDMIEEEEEKREFSSAEDYILRMTIEKLGMCDVVLELIAKELRSKPSEIKARYEYLANHEKVRTSRLKGEMVAVVQDEDAFASKDLEAALDSFDNLFCRRCLVFDCRLHGCSQELVLPAEKQQPWNPFDEDVVPCGSTCYLLVVKCESTATVSSVIAAHEDQQLPSTCNASGLAASRRKESSTSGRKLKSQQAESSSSTANLLSESSVSETQSRRVRSKNTILCGNSNKRASEQAVHDMSKRQKKVVNSDSDCAIKLTESSNLRTTRRRSSPLLPAEKSSSADGCNGTSHKKNVDDVATSSDNVSQKEDLVVATTRKTTDQLWRTIEKSLYAKGLEIYGKNSCLIARNIMNGMKTCAEVAQYMTRNAKNQRRAGDGLNYLVDADGVDDDSDAIGNEPRRRSRFIRRRGRVRRLKYSWKSAGLHAIRKRISDRKDQPCRQYTPCNCQSACGKQCSCHQNGTCCEKYCGCAKTCKNRFRGCHCAKSQCRSRQCPCFAADRECDPDVCRNCWIGSGDGTLGGPPQIGDNYECRNMKLLLKQQQRVLLGKSDVSGWGAFLKSNVNKHEYLGEYTGELISHREADKRGKIYDRENSSFLFNLNDQFVLDAYRKGDKLKFANHSPTPNCYAKVIMVAGDHRVGIYAKERICTGEELFYDYRYEPDRAPAWARKPEGSNPKKDDVLSSHGRAKKLA